MSNDTREARKEAVKVLRQTSDKLPQTALDRLLGYAEGLAAGVDLVKPTEPTKRV